MESRVTQLEDVSDSFWDAVARIQSENAEKGQFSLYVSNH